MLRSTVFALFCTGFAFSAYASAAHHSTTQNSASVKSAVNMMVQEAEGTIANIIYSQRTQSGLIADFKWETNTAESLRSAANETAQKAGLFAISFSLDSAECALDTSTREKFEDEFTVKVLNSPSESAEKLRRFANQRARETAYAILTGALATGKRVATAVKSQYPNAAVFHLPAEKVDTELRKLAVEALKTSDAARSSLLDRRKYVSDEALLSYTREAKSKIRLTKLAIRQVSQALNEFNRKCGYYPSTMEGLDALVKKPKDRDCRNYDPAGFISRLPKDAWGNNFDYLSNGADFELKSYGADGKAGGYGVAADLVTRAG